MNSRAALMGLSLLSLAACSTAPYTPGPPSLEDQRRLANFIGDRQPGPPQKCISAYPGAQIQAVGDKVVAKWGGRVWVNQVDGSCAQADSAGAFLVTQANAAGQYCDTDIWKIVSNSGGMTIGVCRLGPWVPYTR